MVVNMKIFKYIGLLFLISITFFYTEKVIDISKEQDEIMIKIKEYEKTANTNAINAIIENDTIIPGNTGKYIDIDASYKNMRKIGYFEPTLLIYKEIYPEISIYNNYNKYIIKGNSQNKSVSLLYILKNTNTLENILSTVKKYNITINFFIDSQFLNTNISIIDDIKNHEIYNYGINGKYTKDNLIITNNIINNKAKNTANFCLFINKNTESLNNCTNNKMLSLIPISANYYNIKLNLNNGNFFLIDNTKELNTIIEYILSKGYNIVPLSELIIE